MISLRLAFIFLAISYVSAQACVKTTNCTACKQTNGCGYCDIPGGIGICFPSVSQTLCTTVGARWNPDNCAPVVSACVTATDCNSCLNTTGCGWCNLGDFGVCHDSSATCNAIRGSFSTAKCPSGTNCANYSTCQDCVQDTNCTSCQITPTTFTCVSAAQKDLFCPAVFYKQGASCNVTQAALTCANFTTCEACSSGGGQSNSTSTSQPNNSTQSNNTQSNNNISCGWCNFGTTQGGECFATQDQGFCKNVGLWAQPCAQPGQPSTCTNVSDLHFCTGPLLTNNQTDMPWVLKLHDSYFNQKMSNIADTVHSECNNAGIGFCGDCWNAYKQFLCAAASPQCGMASCYQSAIASATDCLAACPCDSSSEFFVQPACFTCTMQCTTNAVAPRCGQFGLSKQTCIQLVNICGCNPQASMANTICQDFSDQGFNVDLGHGTCTDVPTWCGLTSGNMTSSWTDVTNVNASNVSPNSNNSAIPALNNSALMQPAPGRLCPNSHVCMYVYNGLGADVVANPVSTLGGVDNNGNPGTNGTNGGNNGSAISTCANPLLLLAALFLLLFV